MFKAPNPYDDVVLKATDENLTSEDWELNIDVCDRVQNEDEVGARNCVAAVQKRLTHRNANVQLYSLTLADALSKNCGLIVNRELASKAFTQTLQRIVTDRNTHALVRQRILQLIKQWANEFREDESLGIMEETYETLKSQNYSFDVEEPAPVEPSVEELRKEDEELRRVLELSVHDQGGRQAWLKYYEEEQQQKQEQQASASGSGTSVGAHATPNPPSSVAGAPGYVPGPAPVRQQSLASVPAADSRTQAAPISTTVAAAATTSTSVASTTSPTSPGSSGANKPSVSRVRALYDFQPTEQGELAFQKGDVVRVIESAYKDWWRGELKGQTGIFPVNYVEKLADPTPAELAKDAQMEALVFGQAANIDRLLSLLRGLDPRKDNLAENEELQDLYQISLALRPKIVRLIDKYSQKMADLKSMNEKFVTARSTFDRMMEESLAKYNPGAAASDYIQVRSGYAQSGYGYASPGQQEAYAAYYAAQQGQAQAQQAAEAQRQTYATYAQGQPQGGYDYSAYYQQAQQGQQQAYQQQASQDAYAAWYAAQSANAVQAAQQQQQQQQYQQQQQEQPQQQPTGANGYGYLQYGTPTLNVQEATPTSPVGTVGPMSQQSGQVAYASGEQQQPIVGSPSHTYATHASQQPVQSNYTQQPAGPQPQTYPSSGVNPSSQQPDQSTYPHQGQVQQQPAGSQTHVYPALQPDQTAYTHQGQVQQQAAGSQAQAYPSRHPDQTTYTHQGQVQQPSAGSHPQTSPTQQVDQTAHALQQLQLQPGGSEAQAYAVSVTGATATAAETPATAAVAMTSPQ